MQTTNQSGITVTIGDYTITGIAIVPDGVKPPFQPTAHVMIEHKDGEAMSAPLEAFQIALENAVHKFWEENF